MNKESVFSLFQGDTNDVGGLFTRPKTLLVSEMHAQWDIAFFEQYFKEGMVLRSLRLEVNPPQGETQLEDWYKYFNGAGLNLLMFLKDRKVLKLSSLDSQLQEIKDKLICFKESEDYKEESDQKIKKGRNIIGTKMTIQQDWYLAGKTKSH